MYCSFSKTPKNDSCSYSFFQMAPQSLIIQGWLILPCLYLSISDRSPFHTCHDFLEGCVSRRMLKHTLAPGWNFSNVWNVIYSLVKALAVELRVYLQVSDSLTQIVNSFLFPLCFCFVVKKHWNLVDVCCWQCAV